MNDFVERYKELSNEKFNHHEAFAIVTSAIVFGGTWEDLIEVNRVFNRDLNSRLKNLESQLKKLSEGKENERITTAIQSAI